MTSGYSLAGFERRSLMLLLPLLCLALFSSALDPRIPQYFSDAARPVLLNIAGICFSAFFCLFAALLIPASRRFIQLFCVLTAFALLTFADLRSDSRFFYCHTASMLSSLSAALVFLPGDRGRGRSGPGLLPQMFFALLLPLMVSHLLQTMLTALRDFISLTFASGFVNTVLAAAVVPCFALMQTMGMPGIISSVQSLQYPDLHLMCVPGAVALTDLVSLPALLLAAAVFRRGGKRLFLVILGFMAALTSHIGSCVSVELAIVLLFFPGVFVLLMISSLLNYAMALFAQCDTLTNFFLLYQPDLQLLPVNLFLLNAGDRLCIAGAALIPPLLLTALQFVRTRRAAMLQRQRRAKDRGFAITPRSSPDLIALTVLRACGGLSNLVRVNRQGRELMLEPLSLEAVSLEAIAPVLRRRPRLERRRGFIVCDLGENCSVVALRLENLIAQSGAAAAAPQGTQDFSIRDFLIQKHQRTKGANRNGRERHMDADQAAHGQEPL